MHRVLLSTAAALAMSGAASAALAATPVLAKAAAARIPRAQLIEFPDLGHSPQIQAPARFHSALLGWLHHPEVGAPQTR